METIPSAQNFADLTGRLNVAQNEITRLKAALAIAEANSACKLGVPPLDFYSSRPTNAGVDALTVYNSMEPGRAKTEFYARNSARIWAAKEATTGTVE
jgi:hypothetical protein